MLGLRSFRCGALGTVDALMATSRNGARPNVRRGSFSTEFGCPRHVRFTPGRDRWSGHPGSAASCQCTRSPPTYDPHSTRCTAGCPTSRDFVHWRFLDAGELSLRTVSLLPASKNQNNNGSRHQEPTNAIGHFRSPASRSPSKKVLHISPAEQRIYAALTTTTVVRTPPALGPAAAVWLAATKASAPAYASGWQ